MLENSLHVDGFACVERHAAFHAYKRAFAGARVLSLDGGRVWARVGRGLFVGDLEAQSAGDLAQVTRSLARLAVRLGIDRVVFQASRDTRFASLSADSFRRHPGLAVVYRNVSSEIPSENLRFSFGDLDNF